MPGLSTKVSLTGAYLLSLAQSEACRKYMYIYRHTPGSLSLPKRIYTGILTKGSTYIRT